MMHFRAHRLYLLPSGIPGELAFRRSGRSRADFRVDAEHALQAGDVAPQRGVAVSCQRIHRLPPGVAAVLSHGDVFGGDQFLQVRFEIAIGHLQRLLQLGESGLAPPDEVSHDPGSDRLVQDDVQTRFGQGGLGSHFLKPQWSTVRISFREAPGPADGLTMPSSSTPWTHMLWARRFHCPPATRNRPSGLPSARKISIGLANVSATAMSSRSSTMSPAMRTFRGILVPAAIATTAVAEGSA